MADRKLRYALISKFEDRLIMNGIPKTNMNRNKEQWTADELLESYYFDDIVSAMDYYFKVNERPNWTWFGYNGDKVMVAREKKQQDEEFRAEMRKKAKEWLT